MVRLMRWSALLLLLLWVGVACDQGPEVVTISDDDDGSRVALSEGDTLEVRLAGNLGAGFTWEQEIGELTILQQEGETEFVSDSELLGAPATIVLHFKAVGPGEEALRLVYHRSWEDAAPEDRFEVEVVVQ